MTTFKAGLIGAVVLIVFTYLGFTKFANPFASPYTTHVVFANANGLRPNSFVRIAGINVGKVTSISPAPGCKINGNAQQEQRCSWSTVTMTIDDAGLPLHKDATFAIRPRIFLEGNFFVDIRPGSPSAPTAPSGFTFPISQGTEPVQFDQLLTSLQSNTRRNLQILLQQYGLAVKKSGAAFNRSIQYWLPAYEYSAVVTHDALGLQPHDLSNWIAAMATVSGALDSNPQALQSLITNFNRTAGAFAVQSGNLQRAVTELPNTLSAATPAFNALNAAFPPLRELAVALKPGVVSAGPAIDASLPFITQLRLLVRPQELEGLSKDLSHAIPPLAKLTNETIPLMKNGVRPVSSCAANVIYPWSQLTLNDQNFNASNGFPPRKVFVEAVDFLPGLAGESRDFDANGPYIRVLGNGGTFTYSLQPGLFGQALTPIVATQPRLPVAGIRADNPKIPVARPALMPNVPCETQPPITDLSAPSGAPPTQIPTSTTPITLARREAAAKAAIPLLGNLLKSENLRLHVPSNLFSSVSAK